MSTINNMFGALTAKLAAVEAVRFLKNPGQNLVQELQGQGYKKVDYNTAIQKDNELVERLKNKANTKSNIATGALGAAGGLLGAIIPGTFSSNPKLRSRIISGAIGAGLGIAGGLHGKKELNKKINILETIWADSRDKSKGKDYSYFVKESKLDVNDIEDNLGFYLNDKTEKKVRGLINQENANNFALKHPIITGIPTLGIWPLIAKEKAIDNITRKLLRNNTKFQELRNKAKEKEYQKTLKERELEIAELKANQINLATKNLAKGWLSGQLINNMNEKNASVESLEQLNIIKNINPERLKQLRSELRLTKELKNKLDLIASEARVQQNNAAIKNIVDKIKLQSK